MEIKAKKNKKKLNLTTKISSVLFGIFLTSTIFALFIKIFNKNGIWLGLILCIVLAFLGFYYINKGTIMRLITWGITGTIVIGTAIYIIGLSIISKMLEDI